MITVPFQYTIDEAKLLFESAGLEVRMVEMPMTFPSFPETEEQIPTWSVSDPFTKDFENLETAFIRCLQQNRIVELKDVDKIMIYNSFRHKDGKSLPL